MSTTHPSDPLSSRLRELEESLLQRDVRKSRELIALLTDDFIEFGTSGRVCTKQDLVAMLQAETPSTQTTGNFKVQINDYDRQVLLRTNFENIPCDPSAECFAQGREGLVRDSELLCRKWAFDVSAIERRLHVWQGLDDRLVPAPIDKQVADRMPGARWHPVEGAGHFGAVGAADEVFGIVAAELGA